MGWEGIAFGRLIKYANVIKMVYPGVGVWTRDILTTFRGGLHFPIFPRWELELQDRVRRRRVRKISRFFAKKRIFGPIIAQKCNKNRKYRGIWRFRGDEGAANFFLTL